MLARFAKNDVSGSCMLVGAKPQVFRWLALARKRFRELYVGEREVTVFCWLAYTRRMSMRIFDFTGCHDVTIVVFGLTHTSREDVKQWSSVPTECVGLRK